MGAVGVMTSSGVRMSSSEASKHEHAFQAETKQLLDIVTHSLYTDKEVVFFCFLLLCPEPVFSYRVVGGTGVRARAHLQR